VGEPQVRLCISGAALDTGNFGVSALGISVLAGLLERLPEAQIILFDFGRGRGPLDVRLPIDAGSVQRQGAWFSKRLDQPENLITGALQAAVGLQRNPNVRALKEATAALDISGGDSFSDIYGLRRFVLVALRKRLALHLGTPLLLLPQTYGPFRDPRARSIARDILRRADRAWARDPESFQRLRELLGADFDPARHLESVDVAFALPAQRPEPWPPADRWWIQEGPLVGLNVSGLLCNDPAVANRLGLRADVMAATIALIERLLADGVRVVLIPHARGGSAESDDLACQQVLARMDPTGTRLRILPDGFGASETKWFIANTDWMMGGRMHATIAALSSAVPVAGIAYSDKFAGVFQRCGVGDQALDARRLTTGDLVDAAWASWEQRGEVRHRLLREVPKVVAAAAEGFDAVTDRIRSFV
jgi:colanic acid/amylovoran biosynthesis protein